MVFKGAGAAAIACATHCIDLGVSPENVTMCDIDGVIYKGRTDRIDRLNGRFATDTSKRTVLEALEGADVFFGLSAGNCATPEMLLAMTDNPIVFALANRDPEMAYDLASATRPDLIMSTGHSDYPNQVNNILGFPSIFRTARDVRAAKDPFGRAGCGTLPICTISRQAAPDYHHTLRHRSRDVEDFVAARAARLPVVTPSGLS